MVRPTRGRVNTNGQGNKKEVQKVQSARKCKNNDTFLRKITKLKQKGQKTIRNVPYLDYITVIASDLKNSSKETQVALNAIHQASQAYLRGLKDEMGGSCCSSTSKAESTSFLLSMAWMGLKHLISFLMSDKSLVKLLNKQRRINDLHRQEHHHHIHHRHHHHHFHHHHHHNHHAPSDPLAITQEEVHAARSGLVDMDLD